VISRLYHRGSRAFAVCLSLSFVAVPVAAAQSPGTPSSSTPIGTTRPPYLQRGAEVEQRYKIHRERLEQFFGKLSAQLERDAPDLRQKLIPPSPVPFGYQIVPALLPDPAPRSQRSRIVLSPFSWPRTDSIIARGRDQLAALEPRLDSAIHRPAEERLREYGLIVDGYRKLVDGQKFMESLIQYNRLWQSEIARLTDVYKRNNALRYAAFARQALLDSISKGDDQFKRSAEPRLAAYSRPLDSALQKAPTPAFVRVDHPNEHTWVVSVPVYTDITDSIFVGRAQEAIENGWHVHDGGDDFSVKLDIRRIPPSTLYTNGTVPANGEHINIADHMKRFPLDGVAFTTGANTTYVFGEGIIVGPHAIPRRTLVHEFGHMLGFRDGYFRSYEDLGDNGYNVVEVILDPDDVIAAPEYGKARRQHFEQILKER